MYITLTPFQAVLILISLILIAFTILIVFANYKVKKDDSKFDSKEPPSFKNYIDKEINYKKDMWTNTIYSENYPVKTTGLNIKEKKPLKEILTEELNNALSDEKYEEAAKLRDQINKLK
jgi:hypothetical protein